MKQFLLMIVAMLSEGLSALYAQELGTEELYQTQMAWAMVVMEEGQESPVFYNCNRTAVEMAENGMTYNRFRFFRYTISDYEGPFENQQYGYRMADKKIYIYDFEKQQETLAFDFNLSVGDHFTTFNGLEWEVEAVKDTLVKILAPLAGCEATVLPRRLLTVRTLDGRYSDQWMESFGSFTNHFMILSMENVKFAHTLWVKVYGYDYYISREINADPIYSHDTGRMEPDGNYEEEEPVMKCSFENGQVTFEDFQQGFECRYYFCFYRNGSDIYEIYGEEFEPHVDGGDYAWRRDVITFKDLPAPASGSYTIHIGNNTYTTNSTTTGIVNVGTSSSGHTGDLYDLQGRKLKSEPANSIYIKDGRKVAPLK